MLLPGLICLLFYFLPSIFSVPPKLIIIMDVTILNIKCFAGFLTETIYWFSVYRAYCIPLLPQSSVLLCLEIIFFAGHFVKYHHLRYCFLTSHLLWYFIPIHNSRLAIIFGWHCKRKNICHFSALSCILCQFNSGSFCKTSVFSL